MGPSDSDCPGPWGLLFGFSNALRMSKAQWITAIALVFGLKKKRGSGRSFSMTDACVGENDEVSEEASIEELTGQALRALRELEKLNGPSSQEDRSKMALEMGFRKKVFGLLARRGAITKPGGESERSTVRKITEKGREFLRNPAPTTWVGRSVLSAARGEKR